MKLFQLMATTNANSNFRHWALGNVDRAPESRAQPMHSKKNVLQKIKFDGGCALLNKNSVKARLQLSPVHSGSSELRWPQPATRSLAGS
jgi:hypothetical protein